MANAYSTLFIINVMQIYNNIITRIWFHSTVRYTFPIVHYIDYYKNIGLVFVVIFLIFFMGKIIQQILVIYYKKVENSANKYFKKVEKKINGKSCCSSSS